MGKHWEQLRSALARRIRYKVTRGGVLFTFAILVVGFGAIISANNLLFLIVATMLATLLIFLGACAAPPPSTGPASAGAGAPYCR